MRFAFITAIVFCSTANARPKVGTPEYHDSWTESKALTSSYKTYIKEIETRVVEHGRRPVIGVLTEPLRGDID